MLAVRGCASARGRLSTVLVGGRLSRNHAQLGMLMPTSFRMICSVSDFLMLCVVRSVGWCCCSVPGLGIVGHAFLWRFVRTLCLRDGCECATLRFACVWKGLFVYLRFSSRFWVSQASSRHMMAYSILCFMCGCRSHVWRMFNKGTLHQEGECVFAIKRLQFVADQVWSPSCCSS